MFYYYSYIVSAVMSIYYYTNTLPPPSLPYTLLWYTRHPIEYAKRLADKLNYRYPGAAGESYLDVIERVRPVIIELERQRRSIVIVCHLAVLRYVCMY